MCKGGKNEAAPLPRAGAQRSPMYPGVPTSVLNVWCGVTVSDRGRGVSERRDEKGSVRTSMRHAEVEQMRAGRHVRGQHNVVRLHVL